MSRIRFCFRTRNQTKCRRWWFTPRHALPPYVRDGPTHRCREAPRHGTHSRGAM